MPVETVAPFYASDRNPYNYAKVEQVSRDVATQWLTLDEITNQLNLFDDESQDGYVTTLELAARMAVEDYLGMAIFATQYKVYYPGTINAQAFLDLPEVSPGASGVTIDLVQAYTTSNTTPVTISSSAYSYDPTGNRVILTELPNELNPNIVNPLIVTYTQNANTISTYPVIKQAALLLITHLYNNRSNSTDVNLKDIPFGFAQLLRPYKPLVM